MAKTTGITSTPTVNSEGVSKGYVDTNVAASGLPVGTIVAFPSNTYPDLLAPAASSFVLCDGSSYSQAAYNSLYVVIGTAYGSGSGTFNVPNLIERTPMGQHPTGPSGTINRGDSSVANVYHSHTAPAHQHTIPTHWHNLNNHTHDISAHSHTLSNHAHYMTHTHSVNDHNHWFAGHSHGFSISVATSNHTHGVWAKNSGLIAPGAADLDPRSCAAGTTAQNATSNVVGGFQHSHSIISNNGNVIGNPGGQAGSGAATSYSGGFTSGNIVETNVAGTFYSANGDANSTDRTSSSTPAGTFGLDGNSDSTGPSSSDTTPTDGAASTTSNAIPHVIVNFYIKWK